MNNIQPALVSLHEDDEEENSDDISTIQTAMEERENPLNEHRIQTTETALISCIPTHVDEENLVIAPGEGKRPLSLLTDDHCEGLAHPCLLPTGKFGYKMQRDVQLSPVKYFQSTSYLIINRTSLPIQIIYFTPTLFYNSYASQVA